MCSLIVLCRNIKVNAAVVHQSYEYQFLVALYCDTAGLHQYQSQAESHHSYSYNNGDLRQYLPLLPLTTCQNLLAFPDAMEFHAVAGIGRFRFPYQRGF